MHSGLVDHLHLLLGSSEEITNQAFEFDASESLQVPSDPKEMDRVTPDDIFERPTPWVVNGKEFRTSTGYERTIWKDCIIKRAKIRGLVARTRDLMDKEVELQQRNELLQDEVGDLMEENIGLEETIEKLRNKEEDANEEVLNWANGLKEQNEKLVKALKQVELELLVLRKRLAPGKKWPRTVKGKLDGEKVWLGEKRARSL